MNPESAMPMSSQPPQPEAPPGGRGLLRGFWEQLKTIGIAILLALTIRSFVIEPYRIPSGSMLPTLLIGDHLFVNKFIYGIQIPFAGWRLPSLREPRRGDVVVFTVGRDGRNVRPADLFPDLPQERFVKRLVGLPGDRIEVRGPDVLVNGEPLERSPAGEPFMDKQGRVFDRSWERIGDRKHIVLDDPHVWGDSGVFVVEPGRYFMMGDNRDDSNDSRRWGTVRLEDFKGPAFVVYWSWDWNGGWGELLNPFLWWDLFTERMRWSRIGASIL